MRLTRFTQSMRHFKEFIDDNGLVEVTLENLRYTWAMGNFRSKMDRCLCNPTWIAQFPQMSLKGLPKNMSDHNPLFLQLISETNWGPKPFRCMYAWSIDKSFKPLVLDEWSKLGGLSIDYKLKMIKEPIKLWNKNTFT